MTTEIMILTIISIIVSTGSVILLFINSCTKHEIEVKDLQEKIIICLLLLMTSNILSIANVIHLRELYLKIFGV